MPHKEEKKREARKAGDKKKSPQDQIREAFLVSSDLEIAPCNRYCQLGSREPRG